MSSTTSYAEPSTPSRTPSIDRQHGTRNAAEQPVRCPGCAQMARVHPCFPNCDQQPIKYQVIRLCDLRRGDTGVDRLIHRDRRERWLPVVGWEGLYSVSDLGRVRSVERVVTRGDGHRQRIAERILKPSLDTRGYLHISLSRDGAPVNASVHRLVLIAFVGPPPEGMEALHFNDSPTDNRLENLRWGSRSANVRDQVRNGRHHHASKTECAAGHAFSPENTRIATRGNGVTGRVCLTCKRERDRRRAERRQQKSSALLGIMAGEE